MPSTGEPELLSFFRYLEVYRWKLTTIGLVHTDIVTWQAQVKGGEETVGSVVDSRGVIAGGHSNGG